MSEAASQYALLRSKLLEGRAAGTLTEQEEDELLDQMDTVWWSMPDHEQEETSLGLPDAERKALAAALSKISASLEYGRVAEMQRNLNLVLRPNRPTPAWPKDETGQVNYPIEVILAKR